MLNIKVEMTSKYIMGNMTRFIKIMASYYQFIVMI